MTYYLIENRDILNPKQIVFCLGDKNIPIGFKIAKSELDGLDITKVNAICRINEIDYRLGLTNGPQEEYYYFGGIIFNEGLEDLKNLTLQVIIKDTDDHYIYNSRVIGLGNFKPLSLTEKQEQLLEEWKERILSEYISKEEVAENYTLNSEIEIYYISKEDLEYDYNALMSQILGGVN